MAKAYPRATPFSLLELSADTIWTSNLCNYALDGDSLPHVLVDYLNNVKFIFDITIYFYYS